MKIMVNPSPNPLQQLGRQLADSFTRPILAFRGRDRLPVIDGTTAVSGIEHDIVIRRSPYGVPLILSQNLAECYFGLGYVVAQDRMWQLACLKHLAHGQLSQLTGPTGSRADVAVSKLGLIELTTQSVESMSERARNLCAAYATGISALLQTSTYRLPLEFDFVDIKPQPWTIYDVVAVGHLWLWSLFTQIRSHRAAAMTRNIVSDETALADLGILGQITEAEIGPDLFHHQLEDRFSQKMLWGEASAHRPSFQFDKANRMMVFDWSRSRTMPTDPYAAQMQVIGEGTHTSISGVTLPGFPMWLTGQNKESVWAYTTRAQHAQNRSVSDRNIDRHLLSDQLNIDRFILNEPDMGGCPIERAAVLTNSDDMTQVTILDDRPWRHARRWLAQISQESTWQAVAPELWLSIDRWRYGEDNAHGEFPYCMFLSHAISLIFTPLLPQNLLGELWPTPEAAAAQLSEVWSKPQSPWLLPKCHRHLLLASALEATQRELALLQDRLLQGRVDGDLHNPVLGIEWPHLLAAYRRNGRHLSHSIDDGFDRNLAGLLDIAPLSTWLTARDRVRVAYHLDGRSRSELPLGQSGQLVSVFRTDLLDTPIESELAGGPYAHQLILRPSR